MADSAFRGNVWARNLVGPYKFPSFLVQSHQTFPDQLSPTFSIQHHNTSIKNPALIFDVPWWADSKSATIIQIGRGFATETRPEKYVS